MHCLLAINLLFEHAVRSTHWIGNLEEKIVNDELSDGERKILWQQKLMHHLITSLVPKNSKDGFYDCSYNGRQGKNF